jgi:ferredoxin-NADP reductase/CRP-like cAMP-binding protein
MPHDDYELLRNTRLFDALSDEVVRNIAASLQSETVAAGHVIITEGELGDRLFLIRSGVVRIFTHNREGEQLVLARLEAGTYFGEQSLLSERPLRRNASARAMTDVTLLSLSHEVFQRHLRSSPSLKKLLAERGSEQLVKRIAKQLEDSRNSRHSLQSLFNRVRHFCRRQVLFRQGDSSVNAYFLLQGSVEVRFYDDDSQLVSKAQLQPGRFFGELGLLENKPRTGTAVASADSEICVISGDAFREAYKKNPELQGLIDAVTGIYQVPFMGLITQYRGEFLGHPAVQTTIQKKNGETLSASRVIDAEIFSIEYPDVAEKKSLSFQGDPDRMREIKLLDNRLVGVISIGYWRDTQEICRLVYNKTLLDEDDLRQFSASGELALTSQSLVDEEDELCRCIHVKYRSVQELVDRGVTDIEALTKQSGAGNVCGGCRPRIIELLGGSAWLEAKTVGVVKHNDSIRSFRLQPLNRPIKHYKAGQHLVVQARIDGHSVSRSYTLTSTDEQRQYYEITVKREPKGLFSRWLFDHCEEGEILRLTEPQGEISFFPDNEAPAVCLMGGIGITPAIAFARKLTDSKHRRALHIDYSVRSSEMAFSDELAVWPKQHSHITVCVRRTDVDGRLTEGDVAQILGRYRDAEFYICGPQRYEDAVTAILKNLNVAPAKIHVERFAHAGGPTN